VGLWLLEPANLASFAKRVQLPSGPPLKIAQEAIFCYAFGMIDQDFEQQRESEAKIFAVQQQLDRLLRKGVRLQDIVKFLGAEKYLHQEGTAKNPVLHFDVQSFINSEYKYTDIIFPDELVNSGTVILPSDEKELITGSGRGIEKKNIIPRTRYLVELLSEMGLHYSVTEGKNNPKMMRELSYKIFNVPQIKKLVLVNDEEGNATFIIHEFDPKEENISDYAKKTKEQLKELDYQKMTTIIYPGKAGEWKIAIKIAFLEAPQDREAEIDRPEKAPEGWMIKTSLAESLGVSWQTIARAVAAYRKEHPEWFKEYLDPYSNNRKLEHYHPDLVKVLTQKFEPRAKRPEGWMINNSMSAKLNASFATVKRIAEAYRKEHPEWFREFPNLSNRPSEHYHPDLVAIIKKEIQSREKAPEGWMIKTSLAESLGVSWDTVRKAADAYRKNHPEWFRDFLDLSSKPIEHYHPDLVAKLSEELKTKS
jgi:FMN-dependent NADH-azoreductase/signal recognition particle subunit SEC65